MRFARSLPAVLWLLLILPAAGQIAPAPAGSTRFLTPRSFDADGIEELLQRVARFGGVAHLPGGVYRIHRSIRVDGLGPIRIEGEGYGDASNPEGTGFRSQPTRLLWTGEPGGTLLQLDNSVGLSFRQMQFDGGGKAGRLVHLRSKPGWGTGNIRFTSVLFRAADVAIQCGEQEQDFNCADNIYDEVYFIECRTGLRTVNHQSVNHHFRSLVVHRVGVALDCQRGGNVTVESWTAGAFDLLLRVGFGGVYAGTYRFTGGRPEMNGWTRRHARLVEAHPTDSCDIVFEGTQETTGPLNDALPDNNADPVFHIGPRAALTVRNHSHIRPVLKMDGGIYREEHGRWYYDPSTPGSFDITGGEVEIRSPRSMIGDRFADIVRSP
ncbi:MAG: hypothetical protein RMJ35_12020 [Phycisphaerales bacterium]|nr:hypothetical protein [Phycisphaerales bacterium]